MKTIIIGHKNPDMDAVVSAIGYAELKIALGEKGVVAGCAGNLNERILFALGKFQVPEPVFFSDVSPKVGDVMQQNVLTVREDAPVADALRCIGEKRFRGLPVVNDTGNCTGLISSFKINRYLFPSVDNLGKAREVHASLRNLARTFEGVSVTGELSDEVRPLTLIVAAMNPKTFRIRIRAHENPASVVLFIGDRANIIEAALEIGVGAIVATGGTHLSEEILENARAVGTAIIESPLDTATSVLLSRSAMQSKMLLDTKFRTFDPDTPLEQARKEVAMSNDFAFPVVEEDGELVGILSKSDFLNPVPRQLILVDHNEMGQAVAGAPDIPILEIVDHHRISTIVTDSPILFINRPVGSTATIVTEMFEQAGIEIPKPIAGILMCGLISDTLNLTSPTTTVLDRRIMQSLQALVGVDPADLANEIFSVGSPLLTMSAEDAIHADRKPYEHRGKKFTIAQIEELSFSHFWEKTDELLEALEQHRKSSDLFFAALLVTDINTQDSILLVRGDKRLLDLVDFPEAGENLWKLAGIVSRKKQLLPYLNNLVQRAV